MKIEEDIYTIEKLKKMEGLSTRSVHVCLKNNLDTLSKIIIFYKKYGDFTRLKNCGDKSNSELIKACNEYLDCYSITDHEKIEDKRKEIIVNLPIENIENDLTLDELFENDILSIRAVNVCRANGLDSLVKIIGFYKKCSDFTMLKNCGRKSENQLIGICEKYSMRFSQILIEEVKITNENVELFKEFSPLKTAILYRHMEYLISKLNIRAKNGITKFFNKLQGSKEI